MPRLTGKSSQKQSILAGAECTFAVLFFCSQGRDVELFKLLLRAQQKQQPVLIGTGTVDESTQLYNLIQHKLEYWQE